MVVVVVVMGRVVKGVGISDDDDIIIKIEIVLEGVCICCMLAFVWKLECYGRFK